MFWEAVVLLLLVKANVVRGGCSQNLLPLPYLDGYMGKQALLNATTDTRVECATLCVIHPDCHVFSYHRGSRRCQIHWRPNPVLGDAYPGMRSFQIPGCRKSCSRGTTHHLCTICLERFTTALAFNSAVQKCKDVGGALLMWNRTIEYTTYIDYIFTDFNTYQDMWVGASDQVTEGTYLWHDGSPADIPWNTQFGEPRGGASEDCVFLGLGNYQVSPTLVVVTPAFQLSSCTVTRKFLCTYGSSKAGGG